MLPAELKSADLAGYPTEGRALAAEYLPLLRELPLPYLVVLLRELIGFDWKFPAERDRLAGQIAYLAALAPAPRGALMRSFTALQVNEKVLGTAWASNPSAALEQLAAWLWSSHQMDTFSQAAAEFGSAMAEAVPSRMPAQPRLGVVVVGQGASHAPFPLFRRLRPHGVFLQNVRPDNGLEILAAEVQRRARSAARGKQDANGFLHWYIDGGRAEIAPMVTRVSYAALQPARQMLLQRTQRAIDSVGMGPESLRSMLAQLRPEEIGLAAAGADRDTEVLNHFQVSLLTEGSGTQIFSTTFVQWAARECLRRAEPETLLLRYAPRQQQQPMNAMLSGSTESAPDPEGSLVDADMGAYYTWLNLRRLTGADQVRFLAWFEGHGEALVIGPGLPGGTTSDSAMNMEGVLKLLV
jgi:hypothetical protein